MTRKLKLAEFEASFPELAGALKLGEEIEIEDSGKTVMRIVAAEPNNSSVKLGLGAKYAKDFDWEAWEALDAEVLKLFKNPF